MDKRIAAAEKRTGAQIVVAVIERSDSYSELPWKAFALGVFVAGFLVFIFDLLWPGVAAHRAVAVRPAVGKINALYFTPPQLWKAVLA